VNVQTPLFQSNLAQHDAASTKQRLKVESGATRHCHLIPGLGLAWPFCCVPEIAIKPQSKKQGAATNNKTPSSSVPTTPGPGSMFNVQ
jgi:hypothetical protein